MEVFLSIGPEPNERVIIRDVPVYIELQQFDGYKDVELEEAYLSIPERMSSELNISGQYSEVKSAFFFFNGFKLYENGVFFILLFLFSKVLRNVAEGEPFHSRNSFYFSVIGLTLFASAFINLAFQFLNHGHFFSLPLLESLDLPEGIEITSLNMFGDDFILAGIFFVILGYVFKEGTRIYEEQKLTV